MHVRRLQNLQYGVYMCRCTGGDIKSNTRLGNVPGTGRASVQADWLCSCRVAEGERKETSAPTCKKSHLRASIGQPRDTPVSLSRTQKEEQKYRAANRQGFKERASEHPIAPSPMPRHFRHLLLFVCTGHVVNAKRDSGENGRSAQAA